MKIQKSKHGKIEICGDGMVRVEREGKIDIIAFVLLEDSYNLMKKIISGEENEEETEQRFLAAIRLFLKDKATQRKKRKEKKEGPIIKT